MADVIIIMIIVIAAVLILRSQVRKLRKGQCCGGCVGCSCSCMEGHVENTKK